MVELNRIQSAAFYIAVVIAGLCCLCFTLRGDAARMGKHAPDNDIRGQAGLPLQDRVNPNEASAESLARLPGVGMSRAKAIVEYRERFQKFRDCNDLRKVKGIGAVTAENMCEWMRFD